MERETPTVETSFRERLSVWAEIITLLTMATVFTGSFLSGYVGNFLKVPHLIWLSGLAGVALYAMGIVRLRAHFGGYISGELEEASAWQVPVWACVAVLFTPVVLGAIHRPTDYESVGLRKRRSEIVARDIDLHRAFDWTMGLRKAGEEVKVEKISLGDEPTILDLLTAAAEGHKESLDGAVVTVIGQCDPPDGPASERFDLYRLVVTCCVADATAVSVEVARRPTIALDAGGWVRVRGIIRFDSKINPHAPVIHAKMTTKIQKPSEPYL